MVTGTSIRFALHLDAKDTSESKSSPMAQWVRGQCCNQKVVSSNLAKTNNFNFLLS